RDLKLAQRCPTRARQIAKAKLGSGNRVGCNRGTILKQRHALLRNADDHLMAAINRGTGATERKQRDRNQNSAQKTPAHAPLSRKNSSAVCVVARATSSSEIPRAAAMLSATRRVCAGSHRFPRNGVGARYGQSVSTMNSPNDKPAATSAPPGPFLKGPIPVKETK